MANGNTLNSGSLQHQTCLVHLVLEGTKDFANFLCSDLYELV